MLRRKTTADISSERYVIHVQYTLLEIRRLGNCLSPSSLSAVQQRRLN